MAISSTDRRAKCSGFVEKTLSKLVSSEMGATRSFFRTLAKGPKQLLGFGIYMQMLMILIAKLVL
jgi:hypothetical protein